MMLPIFPEGVVELSAELAVRREGGLVVYFNGMMPISQHAEEEDVKSFQMITSQFCCSGVVKQADIARAFGVTDIIRNLSPKKTTMTINFLVRQFFTIR